MLAPFKSVMFIIRLHSIIFSFIKRQVFLALKKGVSLHLGKRNYSIFSPRNHVLWVSREIKKTYIKFGDLEQ